MPLVGYNFQTAYLHPLAKDLNVGGGLVFRHLYLSNSDSMRKASAHLISADANFIAEYKLYAFKKYEIFTDLYFGLGFEAINALKVAQKIGNGSVNLNSYLYNYDVGVQGKIFINEKFCILSGIEFENQIYSGKADYKFTSVNFHIGAGVRF